MSESTSLFDAALARLRRNRLLEGAMLGGSVLLTLPLTNACATSGEDTTTAADQADWAQFEGKRDTSMVSFTGAWSHNCAGENTRFGCGQVAIHLKVRVKPQQNVDLDWKRVGVVYRSPNDPVDRTAVGTYSHTYANGDEEWNVTVQTPAYKPTLIFDTWYQDGKGGTFFDDNQGEFHVVNAGPDYNIVRVEPWLNTIAVGDTKITGKISLQASDLDFDKQLGLVASKDGWATTIHLGTGSQGDKNKVYWVEDFAGADGRERWQIDVDLPANGATRFEYAVVYRHGVVNGAKAYEFWDNNGGGNYQVVKP
jgi:Carbohydrate/starch-binding module (family 21)